jgi:hypothetical protein
MEYESEYDYSDALGEGLGGRIKRGGKPKGALKAWVDRVKKYQKKYGVSYKQALIDLKGSGLGGVLGGVSAGALKKRCPKKKHRRASTGRCSSKGRGRLVGSALKRSSSKAKCRKGTHRKGRKCTKKGSGRLVGSAIRRRKSSRRKSVRRRKSVGGAVRRKSSKRKSSRRKSSRKMRGGCGCCKGSGLMCDTYGRQFACPKCAGCGSALGGVVAGDLDLY